MRNNPDDLANQTLSKIKEICKDATLEFKKEVNFDNVFHHNISYGEIVGCSARKNLAQEILNLIKKEVA